MKQTIKAQIQELKQIVQTEELLDLKVSKVDCEGNRQGVKVSIKPKQKYTYLDVGTSGRYLIEQNGTVWGIKAYGQKGWCKGYITDLIELHKQNIQQLISYQKQKAMVN